MRGVSAAWAQLRPGARGVSVAFAVSGLTHLVRPGLFQPLIPPVLPLPRAWVVGTGIAELVSAAGMLTRARWAPAAAVVTLLVVWPGNLWHAVATQRDPSAPAALKAGVWLRLPLQVPMIVAVADPYHPLLESPAARGG